MNFQMFKLDLEKAEEPEIKLPTFVASQRKQGNSRKKKIYFSFLFNDPMDVGSLFSGSSAFSKSSLNIWKFMVHVLLKPSLENFAIKLIFGLCSVFHPARRREERGCGPVTGKDRVSCQSGGAPALRPFPTSGSFPMSQFFA